MDSVQPTIKHARNVKGRAISLLYADQSQLKKLLLTIPAVMNQNLMMMN